MYKIVNKKDLAPSIKEYEISAPRVASKIKPGQFVIIRLNERGERFPITVANADRSKGTVTLVFNEVGKSTKQMGVLNQGDSVLDLVGPLGNPSEIDKYGRILCFGGGVMTAPLYYVALALKEAGNEILGVVGARIKDLLIYMEEMKSLCSDFHVATDDGSEGHKGVDFIKDILEKQKVDRVVAMSTSEASMRAISEITLPYGIKTTVSLAPIMVDGTGMCGCCRVGLNGETQFACIHGPEFDGHKVDWELLKSRKRMYLPEERISALCYEQFIKD
jgi:ferredoxin--NADP+ reductase